MALSRNLKVWLSSGSAEVEAMLATGWKRMKFHVIPSRTLEFRQYLIRIGARFVQNNLDGSIDAYIAPRHVEVLLKDANWPEFDQREL